MSQGLRHCQEHNEYKARCGACECPRSQSRWSKITNEGRQNACSDQESCLRKCCAFGSLVKSPNHRGCLAVLYFNQDYVVHRNLHLPTSRLLIANISLSCTVILKLSFPCFKCSFGGSGKSRYNSSESCSGGT